MSHAVTQLVQENLPPLDTGRTWSSVRSSRDPQYLRPGGGRPRCCTAPQHPYSPDPPPPPPPRPSVLTPRCDSYAGERSHSRECGDHFLRGPHGGLHVTVQQQSFGYHVTHTTSLLSSEGSATALEILAARPRGSRKACRRCSGPQPAVHSAQTPSATASLRTIAGAGAASNAPQTPVAAEVGGLPTLLLSTYSCRLQQLKPTAAGGCSTCRSGGGEREKGGGGVTGRRTGRAA